MRNIIRTFGVLALLGAFLQGSVLAEDGSDEDILSRLKTISEKQDKIIAELETIKAELSIVKVRTTLNG